MKTLNIQQIASYLKITKRAVQRRAMAENWPYTETKVEGGTQHQYDLAGLPAAIKTAITTSELWENEQGEGE
jgi:hypothetical protein